jgi:hypothetical protein
MSEWVLSLLEQEEADYLLLRETANAVVQGKMDGMGWEANH